MERKATTTGLYLDSKRRKVGGKSNPAASEQGWSLCRARFGAKPRHAQLSALDAHQPAARSPTSTHVMPVSQHAQRGTGTLKCERSVVEARSELQRRDFSAASPITLIRPVPVLSSPLLAASLERPVPGRCLQSAAGCAGGELPEQPGGPAGSGHPSQGLHFWGGCALLARCGLGAAIPSGAPPASSCQLRRPPIPARPAETKLFHGVFLYQGIFCRPCDSHQRLDLQQLRFPGPSHGSRSRCCSSFIWGSLQRS